MKVEKTVQFQVSCMGRRQWDDPMSYHGLLSTYVEQTTTHGCARSPATATRPTGSSGSPSSCARWQAAATTAATSSPTTSPTPRPPSRRRRTPTSREFPSLTVCNLNVIKKVHTPLGVRNS
ncbi:hypothetical protein CEXT_274401 [Caerostris extrusa]|uniref:Uncharacterized protein n=1 Tax=Caerostris extrusa TaxID=172846 RepID=A0AAV4P5W3_CAEEX|nr:hypothetical protein CEXT_274401 [Caerostris extrusa]